MLEHDYTPLFRLEHMLKDVGICLSESGAAGAPFPSAALARELYAAAKGRGLGRRGLRGGPGGGRGARRDPDLTDRPLVCQQKDLICRSIMGSREIVHSM